MSYFLQLIKRSYDYIFCDKSNSYEPECENCAIIFIADKLVLHIRPTSIDVYKTTSLSKADHTVPIRGKLSKHIISGYWIEGTQLIAVVQADKKLFLINYVNGKILQTILDAYLVCRLSDDSLLLFGTNKIRSVSRRTYKTINFITTAYASPAFAVDINAGLILIGTYWDLFIYDNSLINKCSVIRAHGLSISCVKILSSSLIISAAEDFLLTLWHLSTDNQGNLSINKIVTYSLQYLVPRKITLCPHSRSAIILESSF